MRVVMKQKKVLIVATSRQTRGGITAVIKSHAKGQQWKDFSCKWIQTHRDGNPGRKLAYLFIALIQYILLLPFYDIVHIHLTAGSSAIRKTIFFQLAKLFKKKVILHFHPASEIYLYQSNNRKRLSSLFSKADLVLVLSEQWKSWIQDALGRQFHIEVLYNPCPPVNRNIDMQEKNILFAGTVIPRKGYADLLRGFALIADRHKDWKIVFAGNGEVDEAKRLSGELGISHQVVFLGWVSGPEKELAFQKASIYCLASSGEGFPMGVLDAWAYGIPCVVTPVGGLPDFVQDGVNGLVYPVGDVVALSVQLEKYMTDVALRMSVVKETDKLVNGPFNMVFVNKKLGDIYSKI